MRRSTAVLSSLQLPPSFDVRLLQADLAAIAPAEFSVHYNARDYAGRWSGVALRSASGSTRELAAVAPTFRDTPLLDRCPYFRQVLAAFDCPLKSVRLLTLAPGSYIREHSDNA